MNILVVGELNPDLVMEGYRSFPALGKEVLVDDLVLALGSASAICAAGLARLGNNVAFAGKVGADSFGDFCMEALAATGVDTAYVVRDSSTKTGLTVSITSSRDRALVTYSGAIGVFRVSDIAENAWQGRGHLHTSSYFLQESLRPECKEMLKSAHARGLTTSLDPGYDPSEEWSRDLIETLTEVDVFFPNEVELRGITGATEIEEGLRKLGNGRTLTVAKLGRDGCMALLDGVPLHVPAHPVDPVDTTGAGDSFNAGFLHAWLAGRDLESSMRFAAVCGALSTLGAGGTGHQPTADEVERHLGGLKA